MKFADYYEIMQTIARYGHALDAGTAPFDQIFTDDVELDLTHAGPPGQPGPVIKGRQHVLEAMTGSADDPHTYRSALTRPALSHHTTNSEIVADHGDEVEVRSKFLRLGNSQPGPMPILIGQYLDTLIRTIDGWRISRREVISHGP
ncbi:nuclear transport factor 2 family protein [Microbacterium sp. A588]